MPHPTGWSEHVCRSPYLMAAVAKARFRRPERNWDKPGWSANSCSFPSTERSDPPWPTWRALKARVESLRDAVAEVEWVLHEERLQFEAGRSVINVMLDAESALLTNQSLLSQAEQSASIAILALDLSLVGLGLGSTSWRTSSSAQVSSR